MILIFTYTPLFIKQMFISVNLIEYFVILKCRAVVLRKTSNPLILLLFILRIVPSGAISTKYMYSKSH